MKGVPLRKGLIQPIFAWMMIAKTVDLLIPKWLLSTDEGIFDGPDHINLLALEDRKSATKVVEGEIFDGFYTPRMLSQTHVELV